MPLLISHKCDWRKLINADGPPCVFMRNGTDLLNYGQSFLMGELEDEQMDGARRWTAVGCVSHCGQNERAVQLGVTSFHHLTNDWQTGGPGRHTRTKTCIQRQWEKGHPHSSQFYKQVVVPTVSETTACPTPEILNQFWKNKLFRENSIAII